jgi:hypothetical protein
MWKDKAEARDRRHQQDVNSLTESFEVRQDFMLHLALKEITYFKFVLNSILGLLLAIVLEIRISGFPGDPSISGWMIALRLTYIGSVLSLVLAFSLDRFIAASRKTMTRLKPALRRK